MDGFEVLGKYDKMSKTSMHLRILKTIHYQSRRSQSRLDSAE